MRETQSKIGAPIICIMALCAKCGGMLLAPRRAKTRHCPRCGQFVRLV